MYSTTISTSTLLLEISNNNMITRSIYARKHNGVVVTFTIHAGVFASEVAKLPPGSTFPKILKPDMRKHRQGSNFPKILKLLASMSSMGSDGARNLGEIRSLPMFSHFRLQEFCGNSFPADALHTYIHTYIHTYRHTHIHTYTHIYIHTYIHTYMHTYMNQNIRERGKGAGRGWGWAWRLGGCAEGQRLEGGGSQRPILRTLMPSGEMWKAEVGAAGLESPRKTPDATVSSVFGRPYAVASRAVSAPWKC